MSDRMKHILVTVGGLGTLRPAPGTWGSLPAIVLCFTLLALDTPRSVYVIVVLGLAVVAGALCVSLTPWSERRFEDADPRDMVLDEVCGQFIALAPAPLLAFGAPPAAAVVVLVAFALFRVFDIVKPGFIDVSQRLPLGWGVLMDDVLAGAVAGGLVWVGWKVIA